MATQREKIPTEASALAPKPIDQRETEEIHPMSAAQASEKKKRPIGRENTSTLTQHRRDEDITPGTHTIEWRVLDETEQPLEGILVELRSEDAKLVIESKPTSKDGSVLFEHVSASHKYAIYVWPEEPVVSQGVIPEPIGARPDAQ